MLEPDATRRRILEAAGPMFADKGFQAANVREICQAAGANLAAVNYHFRSKEQLYVETVRHAYESVAAAFPMRTWPASVPARRRLREFVRTMLRRLLSPDVPDWHRLLIMREVGQPSATCAAIIENFIRPCHEGLMGILADLLPGNVPEAKRALIACSIVGQCLHYHHARHVMPLLLGPDRRAGLDLDVLTDHIAEFSLAAIRRLRPARTKGVRP